MSIKFFDKKNAGISIWLPIVTGPLISLLSFYFMYKLDPLKLQSMASIPAFFFSVLVLLIGQWIVTVKEIQKTAVYSDRIYDAIKDYLHVTRVGSPEEGMRYIKSRIPVLREVQNTSFNTIEESERSSEKLYETSIYSEISQEIAKNCCNDLIWKDIGDSFAYERFTEISKGCKEKCKNGKCKYKFKIVSHDQPQINFILLEYNDGAKEVLFNWDFRGLGQDPIVLISRDNHIVEMFTIQFNLLWRYGVSAHDSIATKSTSAK